MIKLVTKWSRLTALALFALCLIFGTAVAPAQAEAPPAIPCNFYGYAYINGSLAANGKVITAQIGGVTVGSTTVSAASGRNFVITTTGGTDGASVVFFVDGVQATPTSVYSAGGNVLINLFTYTSTLGVTTGSATGIFSTAAVLAGTLTGLGASPTVNVYFDYGLTASYGSTTTPQAMTAAGGFTTGITGLTPGTTYHFRAKATDGASTVNGLDSSFTTLTPVLTVVTGSATGITTSTATLLGTLSDMGTYSGVNVSFDYGTTTSYGGATGVQSKTSTGAFAATVSSLTPGTTYHFRAKATGGSSTVYGSDVTFTTSSQTGGCTAGCCQWFYGTAYLNGSPVTSGTVAGLVNGVQTATTTLNTGGGFNFYVPVTAGATVTFTVNGLTAAESTSGQCMGVNNNYNLHTSSGTLTVTTGTGTYATTSSAIIAGNLTSLGTDSSATVNFEWGTSAAYGSTTTTTSLSSTGPFTGAISGLTAGVTYYYRAKAVGNASGTIVYGSGMTYVHNAGGTLSVTTGSGSYLNTTQATLSSTLAGLASDTSATCYVDYGTTAGYGSSTTGIVLTSTGGYSGTASGLTSGQTYHIRGRVVGSPSGSIAYGSDVTYVHSAGGSLAVTTGTGTFVDTTSAVLTGTLTSLGSNASAIVSLEYGTSTSYGSITSATTLTSAGAFSGTASGLTSGQTYHFRARAVGSSTGTVYGSDVTYTHTGGCGDDPIGCTAGVAWSTQPANYIYASKYAALSTTTISKINVRCAGSGNIKVAVYTHDAVANAMGTLIPGGKYDTGNGWPVVAGTVTSVPLDSPVSITAGTSYWLVTWSDSTVFAFAHESGTYAYRGMPAFAPFTFASLPSPVNWMYYPTPGLTRGMISGIN
jgi:hypothetical protein